MRIAIISTYTHPTRLARKERGVMQSSVPELIASLCPDDAEVEVYNEKETDVPLDRDWDLVFFSYLHSYYEHTKVLSTLLRRRGVKTVAGGRHAIHFADDCEKYFDAVVTGEPEPNVPALIRDFERGDLQKRYNVPSTGAAAIKPGLDSGGTRHLYAHDQNRSTRIHTLRGQRTSPRVSIRRHSAISMNIV